MAFDESRRIGALFLQVAAGANAISASLVEGRFEDALEMGLVVGRDIAIERASRNRTGISRGSGSIW